MLKSKPVSKIVCVKRGLSASQDAAPAMIYSRGNRQQRRQYLSRDTMAALGDDLHGYFEAGFALQTIAADVFPDFAAGELTHTFEVQAADLNALIRLDAIAEQKRR